MSKIEIPSKIRAENFAEKDREVANKIGGIYNQFVDQIYTILLNNLGFDNLNRQLVQVTVTLDATGTLVNPPAVKLAIKGKVKLVYCGGATCLTDNLTYPTGTPFITGTMNNNTFIIQRVTNLQANTQYSLSLEIVGE